ncbi:MAG: hypothetical protein NTX53_19000 [candidate division WOR-3 bacterium]|nr:hypothetical protein [candidate division WOR-3 bacterium]
MEGHRAIVDFRLQIVDWAERARLRYELRVARYELRVTGTTMGE